MAREEKRLPHPDVQGADCIPCYGVRLHAGTCNTCSFSGQKVPSILKISGLEVLATAAAPISSDWRPAEVNKGYTVSQRRTLLTRRARALLDHTAACPIAVTAMVRAILLITMFVRQALTKKMRNYNSAARATRCDKAC